MRGCRARSPGGCGHQPPARPAPAPLAPRAVHGNQAVLRRLQAGAAPPMPEAPPLVHAVLNSGGRPLDAASRGYFEARMGVGLGAVRLHDDARAAASARAVGARAYAAGPHVVSAAGPLDAARPEARALLAHELAHVAQAGGAAVPARLPIGRTDAPEEQQAAGAATALAAGLPAGQLAPAAPALRRDPVEPKATPDPKPVLLLPGDLRADVVPFLPLPGGSPPSPYDPPNKVTDPSGKAASMEDLNAARSKLFGKTPLDLGMNRATREPDCAELQNAGGARLAGKYMRFEDYTRQRMLWHGPFSKDAWTAFTPGQYAAKIDSCVQAERAPAQPTPPAVAPAPQPAPPAAVPGGAAGH